MALARPTGDSTVCADHGRGIFLARLEKFLLDRRACPCFMAQLARLGERRVTGHYSHNGVISSRLGISFAHRNESWRSGNCAFDFADREVSRFRQPLPSIPGWQAMGGSASV